MKTGRTLALVGGLFIAAHASAQTSFADVANGTAAPSSLKIADLSADYKAIRLHSAGEPSAGMMGSLGGIMMMGMSGGGQNANKMMPAMLQLGALNDLAWTKGQTLNLAGHDFLVTYKLNTGFDAASMSGPSPKLAANLTLNLVRTDTVISIAPEPGINPDQLRKMLSDAGANIDAPALHVEGGNSDQAISAAILLPVFAQAKTAAQETATLSNAKQIALTALLYASDYDDQLPAVQSTDEFRRATIVYTKTHEIWETKNPNGGGFRFAMNLSGVSVTSIDNPAEAPLIYEANAWPDGRRIVAFADGHAKRVSAEQWASIEPMLKKKYPHAKKPKSAEAVTFRR